MAYWLGFLFADGCVHDSKGQVAIELRCTDHDQVQKFKTAMGSTYKLGLYKTSRGHFCKAQHYIYSHQMVSDLIALGCVPRKSLVLDWPKNMPDKYAHHFVRGYFDGDGCIRYDKKCKSIVVHFTGCHLIINCLQIYIKTNVLQHSQFNGSVGGIGKMANNAVKRLTYAGTRTPIQVLDWMYKGSESMTRLERKYIYYQQLSKVICFDTSSRDSMMQNFLQSDRWKNYYECHHHVRCPRFSPHE